MKTFLHKRSGKTKLPCRWIVFFMLIMHGTLCWSQSFYTDGPYQYIINQDGDPTQGATLYSIIDKNRETYVVPSEVTYLSETYPITGINYSFRFSNCLKVRSVTVEYDGVLSYLFENCNSLDSVIIKGNVVNTGAYTFYNCANLTYVDLPESLKIIGNGAFGGCTSLTYIKIPVGVTTLYGQSFSGCSELKKVEIDPIANNLEVIGSYAFSNCAKLSGISIPAKVDSIGSGAFSGCEGLYSITLPSSLPKLNGNTFSGCKHLSFINLPNSIKEIGRSEFANSGLQTIELSSQLKVIPYQAFNRCVSLVNVEIPREVTKIEYGAFACCDSLRTVKLPDGLSNIGEVAFSECKGLREINIPTNVTQIGSFAFMKCESLTTLMLPEVLAKIEEGTLYGCISLTSFTIPKDVAEIGASAFNGCEKLKEIHIKRATPPVFGSSCFGDLPQDAILYVPQGSKDAYVQLGLFDEEYIQEVSTPLSETNINGLKKLQVDNPNSLSLKAYIEGEGWLKESPDENINVVWNNNAPYRQISMLAITNQRDTIQTLDLSKFDKLEALTLNGTFLPTLDVSGLSNLTDLIIYNTGFASFNSISVSEKVRVQGWSQIQLGEPVNDWICNMTAGDTIDLSANKEVQGKKTTYIWQKMGYGKPEIVNLKMIREGVFILPDTLDDVETYQCKMENSVFTDWYIQTPNIRLTRGPINYNQDDIDLLKALAAANPDCVELQQFITAEGWTETWPNNYYDDENRKVAVDWNFDMPARISKLRVRNMNTVKSFDISGFTELEYLDCEGLYLDQLDLSGITKLQVLTANHNNMTTLDLSKNIELQMLEVRGCRGLSRLDLSKCNKLTSLDISSCENLREVNLTGVPLTSLRMNNTTELVNLVKNPPATVRSLYYEGTDYPALDLSKYPSLTGYGVPRQVTELDITGTNIRDLGVSGSGLKFSTLKANDRVSVGGRTQLSIPGLDRNEYNDYVIENGDTIDLSSEAVIDGIASVYTWVDRETRIEVKDAFIQIEGKPGVFKANGKLGKSYFCIVTNKKYTMDGWMINRWGGWRLETYDIQIQTPPAVYDETEVAALKAIVDKCESPSLKAWWNNEDWKNGSSGDWRFGAWWDLDKQTNTFHLMALSLNDLGDTLSTLDVSAFTKLESLACDFSGLTTLSMAENSRLNNLSCGYSLELASLTLPLEKTNLISLYCDNCPKLETLDLTGYTNLEALSVRYNKIQSLDVSAFTKLEYLWCNGSDMTVDITKHPELIEYGVPANVESFDMNSLDALQYLDPSGSKLKFSTVKLKEGQPWSDGYYFTNLQVEGFRPSSSNVTRYLVPSGKPIDFSSEMSINGKASNVEWRAYDRETYEQKAVQVTNEGGKYIVTGRAKDQFEAVITNATFPGWRMSTRFEFYTRDGDANLDEKVDVRDIAVTANWILENENALPYHEFGYSEADVNVDNNVNVADITGIANLIMGKPVTRSTDLRSDFMPVVSLTAENGFLCMESDVPVAGVQLELTGMAKAGPLLGKAATFTQASHAGDTLRMLAYSLKGETIPAGKTVLMRWPEGARLAGAAFSDSQARSLKVETRGDIATSNEVIRVADSSKDIYNYPNPFKGTTTLVYRLDETVDEAFIQVYSFNGSLVDVIDGLNTAAGENRFVYTTRLAAGNYIYRLVTKKHGAVTYSKSNTFIIK